MSFSHFLSASIILGALFAGPVDRLFAQQENSPTKEYLGFPVNVPKKLTVNWQDTQAPLLRSGAESPEMIKGKRTVYELKHGSRKQTIPVVVFSDPQSGLIWAGPERDAYLELNEGILGFRLIGHRIDWCESLLQRDPNKASPDLTSRFEQDISGFTLLQSALPSSELLMKEYSTRLGAYIKNPWMFTNGAFSSQGATPILKELQWDTGLLKLDLTDRTKKFAATVWIDPQTRKVKKAEEKPWSFFGDRKQKVQQ